LATKCQPANAMNSGMKNIFLIFLSACLFVACANRTSQRQCSDSSLNVVQEQLLSQGWNFVDRSGGELGKDYGITPCYGMQDNYFDIQVGNGYDVVLKIVDICTDQTIRCVYVPQNKTVTINQIPQGRYYIKLAFGQAWMECENNGLKIGKFTRNVLYERSYSAYDFGKKNSREMVNYILQLNVVNGRMENNFRTEEISEEEFLK